MSVLVLDFFVCFGFDFGVVVVESKFCLFIVCFVFGFCVVVVAVFFVCCFVYFDFGVVVVAVSFVCLLVLSLWRVSSKVSRVH